MDGDQQSHLLNLPNECVLQILIFLSPADIGNVQLVSKSVFLSAQDNLIWLKFCIEHLRTARAKRIGSASKRNFFGVLSSPTKEKEPPPTPLSSLTPLWVRQEITTERYWKCEYVWFTQKPQKITFQTPGSGGVWCAKHLTVADDDPTHFRVASGGDDGTVLLWDSASTSSIQLGKHAEAVLCLCGGGIGPSYFWKGSENFLFSGSQDHSVKLWDLTTNAFVRNFIGHSASVASCIETGEHTIATGGGDSNVIVWDTRSQNHTNKIYGHEGTVLSLALLDPDGRYILSSARDNTLRIWDTRTCRQLQLHHTTGPVRDMSYSKYGTTLVTGGGYIRSPKLQLYKVNLEDRLVPNYKSLVKMLDPPVHMLGHSDAVCSLTGDSTKVISGSFDSSIKIWSKVYPGECVRTIGEHFKAVTSVHLNRNSSSFVSASLDGFIKIWFWDNRSSL